MSRTDLTNIQHPKSIREAAQQAIQDPVFLEKFNALRINPITRDKQLEDINLNTKILMAYEVYQKFSSKGDVVFSQKTEGITLGFVASCGKENLYAKCFMGSSSGQPDIVELWAYKFLETLNFGAQIEAFNSHGQVPFVVSHGLEKEGHELMFGGRATNYLSDFTNDEVCKSKILALEILSKILGLGDIKHNPENFLIIVDQKNGNISPQIIDFNFRPTSEAVMSKSGSDVTLRGAKRRLAGPDSPGSALALTSIFTATGLNEETYDAALEMISPQAVDRAMATSFEYCVAFVSKVDESLKEQEFSLEKLEKYVEERKAIFLKLNKDKKASRSSLVVAECLDSRRGSGSYVNFGEELPSSSVANPTSQVGQPVVVENPHERGGGCCIIL